MSKQRVLAGVMPVEFYDENMTLICTANALTDEGLQSAVENDEIRGGSANQLIAKYFYNSSLTLNATDTLFSLEYLALKMGATIEMGSDVQKSESLTISEDGKITVSDTPVAFPFTNKIVGSYRKASDADDAWVTVEFNGKDASVSGLKKGDKVCVKYFFKDASAREFKVPTNMIPSTVYAVAKIPEFSAGGDVSSKSQIGTLQVVIPRFQFDPSAELAVTSSGHATTSLTGSALAMFEGNCDGTSNYAILTETTDGADEFADARAIVVDGSDVDLANGESATLRVLAVYNGITAPKIIDNSKLTFAVIEGGETVATVNNGVVQAVGTGNTTVEVTVAGHEKLIATAHVTVA